MLALSRRQGDDRVGFQLADHFGQRLAGLRNGGTGLEQHHVDNGRRVDRDFQFSGSGKQGAEGKGLQLAQVFCSELTAAQVEDRMP